MDFSHLQSTRVSLRYLWPPLSLLPLSCAPFHASTLALLIMLILLLRPLLLPLPPLQVTVLCQSEGLRETVRGRQTEGEVGLGQGAVALLSARGRR